MEPELLRAFGRVEQKVDSLHELFASHIEDDKDNFHKLNKKVESLQGKWKFAAGMAVVVTFIISNFGWNLVQTFLPK